MDKPVVVITGASAGVGRATALPGDHGAHGDFDDRAHPWSRQFWLSVNRRWVALAGLSISGILLAAGAIVKAGSNAGSVRNDLVPQPFLGLNGWPKSVRDD